MTFQPIHIDERSSALSGRKFTWLESGYFDANPIIFCAPVHDRVGPSSDIPIGSLERTRMSQKAANLYAQIRVSDTASGA